MTTEHDLPDDDAMRELARVLRAEVDGVETSPNSLALIQARTAAGGGSTAWRWFVPLAAAAVVALVAVGATLVPRGHDRAATPPTGPIPGTWTPPAPRPTSATPSPTPTPTATASGQLGPGPTHSTGTGAQGSTGCVEAGKTGYAYFVSDLNGAGPRLYRGTITVSCHLGIEEALQVPYGKDPDFTSLWPTGTKVLSWTVAGDQATVDLNQFPELDSAGETAAVQQLVWTVTANRPSIRSVRILVHGAPPSGVLDWSKPVHRGNSLQTLSNVWILTPHSNAVVGSPVVVRIYGTGYEGQVPIKVFQGGVEVASTAVTTRMGGYAEASTTLELPPGTYEIQAYNDSGEDGALTVWDTKIFTVK